VGYPSACPWRKIVRPLRAGVHDILPLGGGEGKPQATTARRPDMASAATSSRLRVRHSGRPNSAGKKGRLRSPWVDGGVVAGLVQRTRDGEEGVRGVGVPACFYSPADGVPVRLPPAAPGAPSTKRRSAPPSPPHSCSPTLFPSPLLAAANREGTKPQCDTAGGRGLAPPGCRRSQ
jgi:hypothetical protein